MSRVAALCVLGHVLLHMTMTTQQGLMSNPSAQLRASNAYDKLKAIYSQSTSFRRAFQTGAASSACSRAAGSLCSPFGQTLEQKAVVLMAASPQAFDARSSGAMGSFSAVAQPKDQGQCNSCVAFALLAAAQSAMACALRQDASSSMSEHDFFFCKTVSPGEERTCASSWTMRQGIESLVSLQFAGNFPVTEGCMPWNPSDPSCSSYECQDVYDGLKEGTFSYVRLETAWEMQEHIRQWGSFITRLEIYSDFRPFFTSRPSGIYPGHGSKATHITSHAIQVVGYDLESNPPSWLCKNSWGTGFAAGGFFRIAFGADGVGSPDDTYGLKFNPKSPRPKPFNRVSRAGTGGCYNYRALPTDFVSRVASVFETSPAQILLDNRDKIKQPDMLLTDMTILLCGISVPEQQPVGRAPTAQVPATPATSSIAQQPPQQQTQAANPQPAGAQSNQQQQKKQGNRYWLMNTYDLIYRHSFSEVWRTAPGSPVCATHENLYWSCSLQECGLLSVPVVKWEGTDVFMYPREGNLNDRIMVRLRANAATLAGGSAVGHIYLWKPCSDPRGQRKGVCCDDFCAPAGTCYTPRNFGHVCKHYGDWHQTMLYFCDV